MNGPAYDSDNIDDIPNDAPIVAYYDDGENGSATPEQLSAKTGQKFSIVRKPGVKGYWMDVENGAATVDDFITAFKAGDVKGIYISWSRVEGELHPKVAAAGIQSGSYDLWSAHWGANTVDPGAVWTQHQSPSSNPPTPGHFDLSHVWSGWVPKGDTQVSNTEVQANPSNSSAMNSDDPIKDATGQEINSPIVAASPTPSGNGYFLFGGDGGVFTFGDAAPAKDGEGRISLSGVKLNKPIIAGWASRSGNGYTLVAEDGGVFTFGDAAFHGSL